MAASPAHGTQARGPEPAPSLSKGRASTWRRTRFDLPLLLFLLSAMIGAWLAFDQTAAAGKFWMIVGGLALYDSLAHAPEEVRLSGHSPDGDLRPTGKATACIRPVHILLIMLPAVIGLYFLLTNDWGQWMGKLPWLDPAMRWFASWQPQLPGHRLHPNVAGGLIAALIPVQIAAVGALGALAPLIGIPCIALAALGLLLTGSRGAWIALAAVAAFWLLWRWQGRHWSRGTWGVLVGVAAVVVALALILALAISPLLGTVGRLDLLRNGLDLALDYPFTGLGLGLGDFQMAYSSYVLLLHVGYVVHTHNLPLNIWLEQGLLGLLAFVWLLVSAARARGTPTPARGSLARGPEPALSLSKGRASASWPWQVAAWAMLGVILLHGLVDDAFYGSRGALLLFIPFALIARGEAIVEAETPAKASTSGNPARNTTPAVVLALASILILIPGLLAPVRAAFQANLGAVAQTRAELSVYKWPQWPIQDAVRRSPEVDLAPAIARYQAALALDGANATANRRLGQIELSRGQYDAAYKHLLAAYAAAPDQRATRQLLGESYAIAGDVTRAAGLWRGLDLSQGQLPLRRWWYEHIGEPQNAGYIQEAETLSAPR